MKRSQKISIVNLLSEKIANSNSLVVVHLKGLNVAKTTELRKKFRQENINFTVTKNTLIKKALEENSTFNQLNHLFHGPTAIIYSNDAIAVAKGAAAFVKESEELKILGGMIDNNFADAKSVEKIAILPSLDELRAKIIGLINAPATRIAGVIKAPSEKVAQVLSAYASKNN